MANTYTQSYFHLVFAVRHRESLIKRSWKNELEMYITGIIQNHTHKLLAIGSMPDHIHIFIGYYLNELIPDLVEKIKTASNAWIKEKKLSKYKFDWSRHGRELWSIYSFPFSVRYRSKVCFKSGSASSKEIIPGRIHRNAY